MKGQYYNSIKLLAMVIPGIFLLVMISSPLLSQDLFYKAGYADPQWFYENFCSKTWVAYHSGAWHESDPPNVNFYTDRMYYSWLDSAGFNTVFTGLMVDNSMGGSDWRDSTWYGDIELFTGFTRLYTYGMAQNKMYGIGHETYPIPDVFQEPYNSQAGEATQDIEEPGDPWIFYSDTSEHQADTLIYDSTWGGYQRFDRTYTMELKIKYRNAIDSAAGLLQVRFGKISSPWGDSEPVYPSHQSLFYPDTSHWNETDDNMSPLHTFRANELTEEGVYDTLSFTHTFGAFRPATKIEVYYLDSADVYLDWIRVYDQEYYNCVLERSNRLDLAMEK